MKTSVTSIIYQLEKKRRRKSPADVQQPAAAATRWPLGPSFRHVVNVLIECTLTRQSGKTTRLKVFVSRLHLFFISETA